MHALPFHPFLIALAGGGLIGLSASALLLVNGRVAGISGIAGGIFAPGTRWDWRVNFLLGLVAGGVLIRLAAPAAIGASVLPGKVAAVGAGLLVGIGTQIGSGCTSGHGVCGLAQGSSRSLAAVMVFMGTGAATVAIWRHLLPGVLP